MRLGERLRELRERRGLSGRAAATYLQISNAHVSDLENGKAKPSLELLVKLADYYHTSADYLLGLEPAPPPALEPEEAELLQLWAELDPAQRNLVLDFLGMLKKARTPRIIGGEEEEGAG
jgi:transcriptional regulator with XRE-family HTH domain